MIDQVDIQYLNVEHSLAESYKSLRTNLLYTENVHVIAVTSSMMGEGKSSTSFQLAKSFAQLGKKTLLVDCDLRKAYLKRFLKVHQKVVGLSEWLSGQVDDAVYASDVENLSLMMSGKSPVNPSELLSGEAFENIIKQLKKEFDYIIIDTPPISVGADASIIGRVVDGVVLVVRNDYVKKITIQRCKQDIIRNGGKLLGVVLNRVNKYQDDYYYGYYGSYE